MRRFPRSGSPDAQIAKGTLEPEAAERLAGVLAQIPYAPGGPRCAARIFPAAAIGAGGKPRDPDAAKFQARSRTRADGAAADGRSAALLPGAARKPRRRRLSRRGARRSETRACLLQNGIFIFDCLEFSDVLRQVDPVDEIAYLAMESERLGAPGWGPAAPAHRRNPRLVRSFSPLRSARGKARAAARASLALASAGCDAETARTLGAAGDAICRPGESARRLGEGRPDLVV